MNSDTYSGEVEVIQVGLGDPRARTLEAAHIAEMNLRYGTGGPGHVAEQGFDPPEGCFLLAVVDGIPVGCGGFRRLDRRRAEIKRMYLDPAVRGRGMGRVLLADLEIRAGMAGYCEVWLETGTEQPEAIALYVSSGYGPVPPYGEFKDDPRSRCFMRPLTA